METTRQQRDERYLDLIERYQDPIFWLCYRRASFRRQLAFDYQQEVRLRIYTSLDTLSPDATPRQEHAWVVSQARSVLSNLARHEHPTLPLGAAGLLVDHDAQREARETIDELMAYLPDDERLLLTQQLEGYSVDEIASGLHLPEPAVRKRISRAKQHLRDIYNRLYNQTNNPKP
ncbi:MAG: sigma-70 family RNA polymerase sigma factor [Bacteroidales bacterium]|nr:sigma-70 family RNA polymerase sigma factor [Bacteroidales bacterium]